MSFKRNISSIMAAAAGAVIFAGAAMAQDTTTATPNTGEKVERHHRGDHSEKGDRKDGRGQWGGRHGGFGKMGGHGFGGGMFRDLNLTDAQKEQLKQVREANKGNKADFDAIKPLMEAKRNGTITADQEAQLKAFRDQRQAKAQQIHEQMLAVLTAEQKALLDQKRTEMKAKREQFKQERQNRRQQKQNGEVTTKPVN
jgi:protein CpxP